jgi:hypothetical protein
MQLAPIWEFIAAMTQFEASQEQVTSDNVGARASTHPCWRC